MTYYGIKVVNSIMYRVLFCFFVLLVIASTVHAQKRVLPRSNEEFILSFSPIAQKAIPAVVNVYATRMVAGRSYGGLESHSVFRYFFERNGFGIPSARVQASLGSGILVSADGIVITNNHVVANAVDIKIALDDRREFKATVIIRDERTDLAVLRVQDHSSAFPFLQLGDSDSLRVGDLVLAIGNPFGVGQTVTSGIVSALARSGVGVTDYQSFIQTDAAINPGNSGGALVDMQGRLIGVNTVIFSRSGGSQGIGFAIPSNMVNLIVKSAINGNVVRRPWLGAQLQTVTTDIARALSMKLPLGVLVSSVTDDSPAARAGLQQGDLIVQVGSRDVDDLDNFGYRFSMQGVEGEVELQVVRDGREIVLSVVLEAAPEIPPRNETLLQGRHPLVGTKVVNLSPAVAEEMRIDLEKKGVIISEVVSATLASSIGLKRGDIIMQVNDEKINNVRTLIRSLSKSSHRWRLIINRYGQTMTMILGG